MAAVILVIHVMVAISLIVAVLLQRSEGGALGIGGGGGGGGGFMTGRGVGNLLTRATAVMAVIFFITSITLTLLANRARDGGSIIDGSSTSGGGAPATSVLPQLPKSPAPSGPKVPVSK